MREDLLEYYRLELEYVNKLGNEFSEKYPALAARLGFKDSERDPHIERLIESFAFLNARTRMTLEASQKSVSSAILNTLAPHLTKPIPSFMMIQLQPSDARGKLENGKLLRSGVKIETAEVSQEKIRCEFETCCDVELWPIRVLGAQISNVKTNNNSNRHAAAISIELEIVGDVSFQTLNIQSLRFYINVQKKGKEGASRLLEYLITSRLPHHVSGLGAIGTPIEPVVLRARRGQESPIEVGGFGERDGLVPFSPSVFLGHRYIYEFFAYPQKFFFFDIFGLDAIKRAGCDRRATIQLQIETGEDELNLGSMDDLFLLGVTPARNLSLKRMRVIPVSPYWAKFEVNVDPADRDHLYEIYDISTVRSSRTNQSNERVVREYRPIHSVVPLDESASGSNLYFTSREFTIGRGSDAHSSPYKKSKIDISFVNSELNPVDMERDVYDIEGWASNAPLIEAVKPSDPAFATLRIPTENAIAVKLIHGPTKPVKAPIDGDHRSKAISFICYNRLNLSNETVAVQSLRELLNINNVAKPSGSLDLIKSVQNISFSADSRRVFYKQGSGICRGVHAKIDIDAAKFEPGYAFIFANVLERFFAAYASINSFSQLEVAFGQDRTVQFPARTGERLLL